jgi:hypothetical protein
MGLKNRYDKALSSGIGLASENPEIAPPQNINPEAQFKGSNLDLEFEVPNGGPINVPYSTQIGSEFKSFNTTQPYTPKNTYIDSLKSKELIRRASDPIR